jgi:hypothetical protein
MCCWELITMLLKSFTTWHEIRSQQGSLQHHKSGTRDM